MADDHSGVQAKRQAGYLAGVDAGGRYRAVKHLPVLDNAVLRVEEDDGKDLVLTVAKLEGEVALSFTRGPQRFIAVEPCRQQLPGLIDYVVHSFLLWLYARFLYRGE